MTPTVERVKAQAFTVPTESPESDGTAEWSSTTLVVVEASAGGVTGLGYTYGAAACAALVSEKLAGAVCGGDALSPQRGYWKMIEAVRNIGHPGVAACALSAVDVALWDLKARLLGKPLCAVIGAVRDEVPIYGSGGFTSYSVDRLCQQLSGWAEAGIPRVKMKVGRDPARDLERVRAAREAIGSAALFVDANGAYQRKQAIQFAAAYAELGVRWFEEPVSSDDLQGLALIRDRAAMEVAAGEYAWGPGDVLRLMACVDVLQADATRCGGVTGFLHVSNLCDAYGLPLSAHCAPALHLHLAMACHQLVHCEWFFDHARIERMLFDGAPAQERGAMRPLLDRPGHGLTFRRAEAERYRV